MGFLLLQLAYVPDIPIDACPNDLGLSLFFLVIFTFSNLFFEAIQTSYLVARSFIYPTL